MTSALICALYVLQKVGCRRPLRPLLGSNWGVTWIGAQGVRLGVCCPWKSWLMEPTVAKKQHAAGCMPLAVALIGAVVAVTMAGRLPPRSHPGYSLTPEALNEALNTPGRFIELSRGRVFYQLHQPTQVEDVLDRAFSPPIVLVHGFSMGSRIWRDVAQKLTDEGRRVLTYDLYGRGFSDATFPNDLGLFTGQLVELLFSLQPVLGAGPYDIVGISMGGAIAVGFAALHPQSVRRLALLAPAGFPVHVPLTAKLARTPLIGDLIMPFLGPLSLKQHSIGGHAYPDDPFVKALLERSGAELALQAKRNPGFFPSLLSTIRDFPLGELEWAYRTIAEQRKENSTVVIWGERDTVTPFQHAQRVMSILGGTAQLSVLRDCGHVDMLTIPRHKAQLLPLLLDYLR